MKSAKAKLWINAIGLCFSCTKHFLSVIKNPNMLSAQLDLAYIAAFANSQFRFGHSIR